MLYIKNNEIKNIKKIVIVADGMRVFNPRVEQVLSDGWRPYTSPIPEYPEVSQEEQYKDRVIELVREKYSIDDELAIQRQRDTKIEEFNVYYSFVEDCKIKAKEEIYGDELV